MKKTININESWQFHKDGDLSLQTVNLPHTYNNLDGQDGGNDYYRGKCNYRKQLEIDFSENQFVYIEFKGTGQSAEVFVNGNFAFRHEGGYATFRFDITRLLKHGLNEISVNVDNSVSDSIYPQTADFTFFGGIYRDVNLIIADATHFELEYYGGKGVKVTPGNVDGKWIIEFVPYINGNDNATVKWTVTDRDNNIVAQIDGGKQAVTAEITNPILWDGVDNPYLYMVSAQLFDNGIECDEVSLKVGLRAFYVDKDKGFFLNGRSYPLRGVSRHQDRINKGYAIGVAEHEEDIALIKEIGANSVRLAHYQHDDYFYELCDEAGLVVWAEIPYITVHLPNGDENALLQFKELITQCYHHASICFWGLSNEITLHGVTDKIILLHKKLLEVAKDDDTRLTTMAHIFTLKPEENLVGITDLSAYNHYFGWYLGEVGQYKEWFDNFRSVRPEVCIGLSEYGADAMTEYQSAIPEVGDYSESYQAYYHEEVLKQIEQMPYLWCSYVWNMFDFACDSRNEAGFPGINHKGLVTYDRKIKKDAFYVYKAYWSKEPFIHIAGKRYVYRHENITKIKVYTNQTEVTLFVDGKPVETKQGKNVFEFEFAISGKHEIKAKSGLLTDSFNLEKVDKPYAPYICGGSAVKNWFDTDGLSLKSKVREIVAVKGGKEFLEQLLCEMKAKRNSDLNGSESMDPIKMMSAFSLEKLLVMGGITDANKINEINENLKKLSK